MIAGARRQDIAQLLGVVLGDVPARADLEREHIVDLVCAIESRGVVWLVALRSVSCCNYAVAVTDRREWLLVGFFLGVRAVGAGGVSRAIDSSER